MVKLKIVELKNTHQIMNAHKGVLLRILMSALARYKPEKVILERNENIKMHISEELLKNPKFGGRILEKGPLQVINKE